MSGGSIRGGPKICSQVSVSKTTGKVETGEARAKKEPWLAGNYEENNGKIIVATCSMGDFPPRVWFEYQRVSRKHVILIEVGSLATLCW